jgi:hypothetical protein
MENSEESFRVNKTITFGATNNVFTVVSINSTDNTTALKITFPCIL